MTGTNGHGLVAVDVDKAMDGLGRIVSPARIVFDGEHVVEVGERATLGVSETNVEIHNYEGCTALPGLVDTHVHLMLGTGLRNYEEVMREDSDPILLLRAAENLRAHLRCGVTTLRDLGARGRVTFDLREAAQRGVLGPTPNMVLSGRSITPTGGHFWFCGEEADGEVGVRASVRRLVHQGADSIKFMVTGGGTAGTDRTRAYFTQAELSAGIDEAHRRRRPVSAHCHGTEGIRLALESGIADTDSIEHCSFFDLGGVMRFDEPLAAELAARQVAVNTTLHVLAYRLELFEELAGERPLTPGEQAQLDYVRHRVEVGLDFTSRHHKLGAKLVGGSDAIARFGDYYLTYELLRQGGLSTQEALAAVTSGAAEAASVGKLTGALKPGLLADMMIIEGDLERDDRALRKVRQVYRAGVPVLPDVPSTSTVA